MNFGTVSIKGISMRFWLTVLALAAVSTLVWSLLYKNTPQSDLKVTQPRIQSIRPVAEPNHEFVQSQTCRTCHPDQHASWDRTFHRTMTQVASPSTALAPFAGEKLEHLGRTYEFTQDGDKLWVNMLDMDWDADLVANGGRPNLVRNQPRVTQEVVMSTGSHHYQTYWVSSKYGNALWQVPWVFHIQAERWIPANDAFLTAPHADHRRVVWNAGCIQCHAVNGQPGMDHTNGEYNSKVAEFGISCESCHGPGHDHVELHRGKTAADVIGSDRPDSTIVNPSKLSSKLSSHVCGQCHSSFSFSDSEYFQSGFKYRAGDDLHATRLIHSLDHPHIQERPNLQLGYWKDGTMRVGGREFSAMDDSSCFQNGEMSCLSCHSMHSSDPNDQLGAEMDTDHACLQCHQNIQDDLTAHTHHLADSSGSRCYNCHMPHTSFALLKAIRSHRVDSPTAAMTAEHGRPNACNLCHLDRTLAWTAENLAKWYNHPQPALEPEDHEVSSSLLMLLRGDAIQRSIVAWHFGWSPAMEASGEDWQPLYLGFLLNDLYSAVRWIAHQSLQRYSRFQNFEYDFIGSDQYLATTPSEVFELWEPPLKIGENHVLLDEIGGMLEQQILKFLRQRDDTPIQLPE